MDRSFLSCLNKSSNSSRVHSSFSWLVNPVNIWAAATFGWTGSEPVGRVVGMSRAARGLTFFFLSLPLGLDLFMEPSSLSTVPVRVRRRAGAGASPLKSVAVRYQICSKLGAKI